MNVSTDTGPEIDLKLAEEISKNRNIQLSFHSYKLLPVELKLFGTHVDAIYLKHNHLEELPRWIGRLLNLKRLVLQGNKLETLPEEIGELKTLRHLDVSRNQLKSIPDSVCELRDLNDLILDTNRLVRLPERIGLLPSLIKLSFANNLVTHLPVSIGCCYTLEKLEAENNRTLFLPNNIVFLPNLYSINFNRNALLYFPSIPFESKVAVKIHKNPSLTYISYDLFRSESNPYSLNPFEIESITRDLDTTLPEALRFADLVKLKNAVLSLTDRRWINAETPVTYIVLPSLMRNVYKMDNAYVPSLFELLLRNIYIWTSYADRTYTYYKTDRGIIPKDLMDILTMGPAGKCQHCRSYIFTESVISVVPVQYTSRLGRKKAVLTVVYFCSSYCVNAFKSNKDLDFMDRCTQLISLDWVKLH